MRTRLRVTSALAGVAALFGGGFIGLVPADAAVTAQTLTIGIDNAAPAGHNWEFLDYFPNGGVNVHNGDTLHFKFNTASLDGFHTATLGKIGESLPSLAANNPTLVPDADSGDAAGQQQFTPTFPPSNLPPGTCGSSVLTACNYDGTSYESSGALFSTPGGPGPFGTEWYIKVQLGSSPTQPSLINYFCRVHGPAMSASFTIVPDGSTASNQDDVTLAATAQYNADLKAGQAATAAVTAAAVTTNANGTHTVSMHAGTESPDGRVQVLEMLPSSLSITAGDTVNWATLTRNDPHTVTFPSPTAGFGEVFPGVCEDATADTPNPTQNPGACAGGPPNFELHYAPQPIGPTAITSSTTQASSGVIDLGPPYAVGATNYSFTFPNAGTFTYQCAIHDHMTGQVLAAAVVVAPTLPKAGQGVRVQVPVKGDGIIPVIAILGLIALVAVARFAARQER